MVLSLRTIEVFRSALMKTDILVLFKLDVPGGQFNLIPIHGIGIHGISSLLMEKFSQVCNSNRFTC